MTAGPLLAVEDLRVRFRTEGREVVAVDGVSLHVDRAEVVALVGESGSGKTATAMAIARLIAPPGKITGGRVLLEGVDLLRLPEPDMRRVRGRRIAMVFQNALTALNPVLTVGRQIEEAILAHGGHGRRDASVRALELLADVGIPNPRRSIDEYPHRFSGGMRQRIVIAIALSCGPDLIIADEPTTALDVTIQAQIIELLQRLREERGMAILFVSHDLGVVARLVDHVHVMHAGKIVEDGPVVDVFTSPRHRYTRSLLAAVPRLDRPVEEQLAALDGAGPAP